MAEKLLLAEKMRELSATSQYRKLVATMNKLQREFSNRRFVHIANPMPQTLEKLKEEGFTVSKTSVKEYDNYKVLW